MSDPNVEGIREPVAAAVYGLEQVSDEMGDSRDMLNVGYIRRDVQTALAGLQSYRKTFWVWYQPRSNRARNTLAMPKIY